MSLTAGGSLQPQGLAHCIFDDALGLRVGAVPRIAWRQRPRSRGVNDLAHLLDHWFGRPAAFDNHLTGCFEPAHAIDDALLRGFDVAQANGA